MNWKTILTFCFFAMTVFIMQSGCGSDDDSSSDSDSDSDSDDDDDNDNDNDDTSDDDDDDSSDDDDDNDSGDDDDDSSADDDDSSDDDDDSSNDDDDNDTDITDSEFTVNVELSSKIGTVGIVTWSIDQDSIDDAYIEFGLDTDYGMKAPVDLDETDYRTLLLGMKPSSDYHFRITAKDGDTTYQSDDYTVTTGAVTNLISAPSVQTNNADAIAGGFILSTTFNIMGGGSPITFILDADGELVWWYQVPISDTAAARMSYDGTHIGIVPVNNSGSGGQIHIVSMDGLDSNTYSQSGVTHDITPCPDGGFAFIDISGKRQGGENDTCGRVLEISLTGTTKEIYDTSDFYGASGCHGNSIRYSATEDIYTVGDKNYSTILAIDRDGTLLWSIGQEGEDFTGNASWSDQHGHQLLDDGLLVFDNGSNTAEEYSLNMSSMTATQIMSYSSSSTSMVMGDVQRLPNGNTLVTYSNSGVMHEIDSDKNLVRKISFSQAAVGYAEWRSTLYGPGENITM